MWIENLIRFIHLLFIVFVLISPFVPYELLLTYHVIIIPFLWFHWITNNNTCALTMIESTIRGEEDTSKTFMGSIINPIYEPKGYEYYILTALLVSISYYRLKTEFNFGLIKLTFFHINRIMMGLLKKIE